MLKSALESAHKDSDIEFALVPIQSNADWKKSEGEKPLCEEAGGKGLFAKEIEHALLDGDIDCGAHSLKDMACFLPTGLVIEHYLPRANPFDAFISRDYKTIDELPKGATIGTCSARRKAMALSKRPDLNIAPFRGNVQTRLDKIHEGQVDATYLAMAGLERLNIEDDAIHALSAEDMLPACGQGIVCIEMREQDDETCAILDAINCNKTAICATAEREILKILDGSCHTPIAAYATLNGDRLELKTEVYSLDGQQVFKEELAEACHNINDAMQIGQRVGNNLKARLPEGFLL